MSRVLRMKGSEPGGVDIRGGEEQSGGRTFCENAFVLAKDDFWSSEILQQSCQDCSRVELS